MNSETWAISWIILRIFVLQRFEENYCVNFDYIYILSLFTVITFYFLLLSYSETSIRDVAVDTSGTKEIFLKENHSNVERIHQRT